MGEGESRFRLSLRAGSVNGYVVTGQILKNLRATISQGKDKNFPEKLIDLGFFRLLKFSPRAT